MSNRNVLFNVRAVRDTGQVKDSSVSFHRFPRDPALRAVWLSTYEVQENNLKPRAPNL